MSVRVELAVKCVQRARPKALELPAWKSVHAILLWTHD